MVQNHIYFICFIANNCKIWLWLSPMDIERLVFFFLKKKKLINLKNTTKSKKDNRKDWESMLKTMGQYFEVPFQLFSCGL